MRKITYAALAAVLVFLGGSQLARSQPQQKTQTSRLVAVMRYVGTEEYIFFRANRKCATKAELAAYIQKNGSGYAQHEDISPQSLKPYELNIMTTSDSMHFEASLTESTNMHDRSNWCQPAVFMDTQGGIYTGLNIGCEAAGQPAK